MRVLLPLQELHAALRKVQGELGKYSSVNKKALDQFVNFTEQRQELSRRVEEVTQSGAAGGVPRSVSLCQMFERLKSSSEARRGYLCR